MLAIISTNKNKYSETFIRSHVQYLDDSLLFLFDGYFPTKFSLDKGFTEVSLHNKWSLLNPSKSLKKLFKKHDVKVVLAEYGQSGVELMDICYEMNIRLVVHFHGFDAYRVDVMKSYGQRYHELFQKADAVIVVSENMRNQLLQLGCPENKIHLIYYGIDTSIFTNNERINLDLQFVSCGRFVSKKAPQHTIEAFQKVFEFYPQARLVMIGDGELLEMCKEKVNQLGLSNAVIFTGSLTAKEIAEIYHHSMCFVQHSVITEDQDSEGTPLAILEAMASGLPIIATRHGGIPEVVKDGVNGYLVNEHDTFGMAEKMKLILQNRSHSAEIGKHNSIYSCTNFSMEGYIEQLKQVIFV